MHLIRDTIYQVLAAENPMTVRQVFYQMVSRGIIASSEGNQVIPGTENVKIGLNIYRRLKK